MRSRAVRLVRTAVSPRGRRAASVRSMSSPPIVPPATDSVTADEPPESSALLTVARRIGAAIAAGMLAGLVVGGIGGRIAMFILRVTSSSRVIGITSDDGFRIGRISAETLFLLIFTTALGAVGGLIYLFGRQWVPARWRVAVSGTFFGVVLAAGVIKPDGVDFSLLSPLWLAVALFVLISVAFGLVVSLLVERLLAREARQGLGWWVYLPLPALLLGGPVAWLAIVVTWLAWAIGHTVPVVGRAWRSPVVVWLGRAAIAALIVVNAVALADDVTTIL